MQQGDVRRRAINKRITDTRNKKRTTSIVRLTNETQYIVAETITCFMNARKSQNEAGSSRINTHMNGSNTGANRQDEYTENRPVQMEGYNANNKDNTSQISYNHFEKIINWLPKGLAKVTVNKSWRRCKYRRRYLSQWKPTLGEGRIWSRSILKRGRFWTCARQHRESGKNGWGRGGGIRGDLTLWGKGRWQKCRRRRKSMVCIIKGGKLKRKTTGSGAATTGKN